MNEVPSASGDEDRELIRRAIEGDRQAMTQLVIRHQKFVYTIAKRSYRLDTHDAEDVVQIVLANLIRKISDFENQEREIKGWLVMNVKYTALGIWRKRARSRSLPTNFDLQDTRQHEPFERLQDDERFARIWSNVLELPDLTRSIFLSYIVDDAPTSELANKYDCTDATIRWHVWRARNALRHLGE